MSKHLAIKVTNKYESEAVLNILESMNFLTEDLGLIITPCHIIAKINMPNTKYIGFLYNKIGYILIDESNFLDECIVASFSDFFSTYAGHIERFPDYVEEEHEEELEYKRIQNHPIYCDKCNRATARYSLLYYDALGSGCDCGGKYTLLEPKKEELKPLSETSVIFHKESDKKPNPLFQKLNFEFKECTLSEELRNCHGCQFNCEKNTSNIQKEKQEPKFKVGDKLWHVFEWRIDTYIVTGMIKDSYLLKELYAENNIMIAHYEIDQEAMLASFWFSTPELAAKRFLELNK